jgi:micrococcal nuclease
MKETIAYVLVFAAAMSSLVLVEQLRIRANHYLDSFAAVEASQEKRSPSATTSVQGLAPVVRVVDGDTVVVDIAGHYETVRLIGIDSPEVVDPLKPVECFGKEASAEAKHVLQGEEVNVVMDPSQGERDKYGRLLAYLFLPDGENVNLHMIQAGFAYEYTYDQPYLYQEQFKAAQKEAQKERVGLWASSTCNGHA